MGVKWLEVAVDTADEAAEAVSERLMRLGAGGVAVEDRRWYSPAEGKFGEMYSAAPEELPWQGVRIIGYFPLSASGAFDSVEVSLARENLASAIRETMAFFPEAEKATIRMQVIEETVWAGAWKQYFRPVRVSRRLTVVPAWEPYVPAEGERVLRIDPGMAFGTGTHATTAMCLRLLDQWMHGGEIVYDVGCGSGILAIAAAKLGAHRVVALDVDPVAVAVAKDNVAVAGTGSVIEVRHNDLLAGVTEKANLIVATILPDVILRLAPDAARLLLDGGVFVVSGIIPEKETTVAGRLAACGLTMVNRLQEDQWVALALTKSNDEVQRCSGTL
jgi:ribosomal protein L11 methyltransferase